MSRAASLIDDLGGPAVVASAIGYEPTAVRMMKHRGKIPRTAWPEILKGFPAQVSLDRLLETEVEDEAAVGA